jgi:hypothetical protein
MTEETIKQPPKKAPRGSFPFGLIGWIIAIGGIAWGVYEHRHGGELSTAVSQADSQVTQVKQQLSAEDELVESLNRQLNDLRKKSMPVTIVMRRGSPQAGLTAYFKNNAPTPMTISVILNNPVTGRRREANMIIPANEIRSIGEPEGWVFAPGHVIQMTQEQFGTVEYVVPEEDVKR